MSGIDNKINDLLSKDELPFKANDAILQQLNYHLQLKTASSKIKQNSIIPFLGGVLTTKLIGLKISVVAIALFAFIGYKGINQPSLMFPLTDSINVSKSVDSASSFSVDDSLIVY